VLYRGLNGLFHTGPCSSFSLNVPTDPCSVEVESDNLNQSCRGYSTLLFAFITAARVQQQKIYLKFRRTCALPRSHLDSGPWTSYYSFFTDGLVFCRGFCYCQNFWNSIILLSRATVFSLNFRWTLVPSRSDFWFLRNRLFQTYLARVPALYLYFPMDSWFIEVESSNHHARFWSDFGC